MAKEVANAVCKLSTDTECYSRRYDRSCDFNAGNTFVVWKCPHRVELTFIEEASETLEVSKDEDQRELPEVF